MKIEGFITKVYEDGSTGDYFCMCVFCKRRFIGHKRDLACGQVDCEEQETNNE